MIEDPRENLPSASSFGITYHCAGSENLIRALPPEALNIVDEPDEMRDRGVKLHDALWQSDPSGLEEDEFEDYTKAAKFAEAVENSWYSQIGGLTRGTTLYREERLWLMDDGLEKLLSGQPDFVRVCGKDALVMDYKTGWNHALTPSEQSHQLRTLAVLVWKNYGCTNIRVGFIKPKSHYDPTDCTDYTESDLIQAEQQILHALWKAKQPDAQRTPGSHCNWCKAKGHCSEAGAYALLPSVIGPDPLEIVQFMQPADLLVLVERSTIILKVLEAAKKRARALPTETLAALGWQVGKGKRLDSITDTYMAFATINNELAKKGVTNPGLTLWPTLKFTKGDLTEAVREATGMTKTDTDQWLREILKPFVEEKRAHGALGRVL